MTSPYVEPSVHRLVPIVVLLAASCARVAGDRDVRGGEPSPSGTAHRLYETDGMVLEDRTHGPELCVGGVEESLPPQCGGLPLVNWDWSRVEGEETMVGTTWGEYHVVGRYDGERFAVTDVGQFHPPTPLEDEIPTPCPEPPGGWVAHDPGRTTEDDRLAATRWAEAQPEHAGTWVQTTAGEGVRVVNEDTILIIAVTQDVERFEAGLRELWGGPLCVVEHAKSLDELSRIQRELSDDPPFGLESTWSDIDVVANRVEIGVIVADEAVRAALDERYGEGTVELHPVLHPVS